MELTEEVDLKLVPYEQIEFAAGELKDMASQFRSLNDCLPDVAVRAKGQLKLCADMLDRRADKLYYVSCPHNFKGIAQRGTSDGSAEYLLICDNCGAEKEEV